MSKLTSQQRKLMYLAGMGLLLIPVLVLGFPASKTREQAGGVLARMRQENDLGESTLGDVDPSSATMNLVLLGLRGPAACMLWVQMDQEKDRKDWPAMRATTESIIKLQPHFQKVWQYNAWNLAYNVSVEWDAVKDRYAWVKEGAKFFKAGSKRNYKYPELYWYYSDTIGKKIGRSDEWRQFRRYFKSDPEPEFEVNGIPGPDRELNPDGIDNYAESAKWFKITNEVLEQYGKEQHIMDRSLFKSYPGRAMIDHASSLQKEGRFDEETREIWAKAFQYWKQIYGQEVWYPARDIAIHLDWNKDEIEKFVANSPLPESYKDKDKKQYELDLRSWVGRYQNMTNFRYWYNKTYSEQDRNTMEAHKDLYDALVVFPQGDTTEAARLAYQGLTKYEKILADKVAGTGLKDDDLAIEEVMLGIMTWRKALELEDKPIPEDFPLKNMWIAHQNRMKQLEQEFNRRISPQRN